MALNDINKDELQDFADAVDVDSSGNKPDIVQRLEDEGYTEEDVKNFQEGTFEPNADEDEAAGAEESDAVDADRVEAVVNVPDEEDSDEEEENGEQREAEEEEEEKILLKLDGNAGSISTAGVTFTREHPYVPVPRDVADELLKSSMFRQAHPSEAEEYYS